MAEDTPAKKKKEDTVEVAKSGRAKCRGCGDKIEKGALRFGLVDFAFSESGSHRWFHLACAQSNASDRLQAALTKSEDELAPHKETIDAELGGAPAPAPSASKAPSSESAERILSKDDWPAWLKKKKPPTRKIPHWARSAKQPTTKDGLLLDGEACVRLVGAMMSDKRGKPDKALAEFRAWLEPSSYRNFAWALFRNWAHADAHMVQSWVIRHVAMVVDDDMAGPLGQAIEVLDKKKKRDAVRESAAALCAHGTPSALQVVQRLAQRYKYRGNNNPPLAALKREASSRGVSLGVLEDMSVPSCGLDARGARRFSYGPRSFRLEVDSTMRISVVAEDDGTRMSRLPKAWERDDPEQVRQAQADFVRLKRDIEAMLPVQARRLEGALSSGREWTLAGWTKHVRRHPLMQIIARRLVWAAYRGDERIKSFRVDDQDEIIDENDDACRIPETCSVRLAHPANMSPAERGAWGELFADYEIMPPFAQLARPAFALDETQRQRTSFDTFCHDPADIGPLHGRFNRADWIKGIVDDDVRIRTFQKFFADGISAIAHLTPGFHPAGHDDGPQSVTHVEFRNGYRSVIPLKDVPPAVMSEVIYDLNQVAG